MNSRVASIINELKKLDLSKYPRERIEELFQGLGDIGFVVETIHEGKEIVRARQNHNGERFSSVCELTYKPQRFNNTYQRASTPYQTMFYGSLIPERIQQGELNNPSVISLLETLSWTRSKTSSGHAVITFSKWRVIKEIKLIAVVQHANYYERSAYTRERVDAFHNFLDHNQEQKERTLTFIDFLASEFAKEDISQDYDYMISALFCEVMASRSLDNGHRLSGVLYPSVRMNGDGFNVAIDPETADSCLELTSVIECAVYKKSEQTYVDNEAFAELHSRQTHFELTDLSEPDRFGPDKCLELIGAASISELK